VARQVQDPQTGGLLGCIFVDSQGQTRALTAQAGPNYTFCRCGRIVEQGQEAGQVPKLVDGQALAAPAATLGSVELRTRRRALGLTQSELADRLGVSPNTVARWERGEQNIGNATRVARTLARLERRAGTATTVQTRGNNARSARRLPPHSFPFTSERRHNLPAELSSFVGRQEQIERLVQRLATTRLLTLIGPGGVGKTRLALRVAQQVIDDFVAGVWLVDLAQVTDNGAVPYAVASALGIRERGRGQLARHLADALRNVSLLLVLDNCEHVLDGCAEFAQMILRACPEVTILATSREPVRVSGEVRWPVPPMSLDASGVTSAVTDSEAAQLFIERAKAITSDFDDSPLSRNVVVDVCRRLDGLPLAIELAAARTHSIPVRTLLDQIESLPGGLDLLTEGPRDAPARQRTLRATLTWSYDLLDADERVLFRRLAPFRGFSLDAVSTMFATADEGPRSSSVSLVPLATDVHQGLASLIDKSLLQVDVGVDGQPWYAMLETVREFALERLESSPEASAVWRRHAWYYLHLVEQTEPVLRSMREDAFLNRLEREHGNFRVALDWCTAHGYAELTLRLAVELLWFWGVRGHVAEGRTRLEELLARFPLRTATGKRAVLHAHALEAAGKLAGLQGDLAAADRFHKQSLDLAEALGETEATCNALNGLAFVAHQRDDYAAARVYLERALATARATASREPTATWRIAQELVGLANIAEDQGDFVAAVPLLLESSSLFAQSGDLSYAAMNSVELGVVAHDQRDFVQARELIGRGLAFFERTDEQRSAAMALAHLARTATAQRDFSLAHQYLSRSMQINQEHGELAGIAFTLICFGLLAAAEGQPARALRLVGAAEGLRERAETLIAPAVQRRFDKELEPIKKELGRVADMAIAEGRAFTLEDAVAEAMATEPRNTAASSDGTDTLSPRERTVATLIGRGFSNRRIAGELVLAQTTVATHVQHILAKLGLGSRAQIAVWVSEQGWLREPSVSSS
jgi:predicted ATPase/DNA-binding CsgD family transcriptional regulator